MTPQEFAATHKAAFEDSRPWTAAEFEALLADRFCFAVGDQRCFALVRVVAGEAELLTIATHPDHRRQGLALNVMTRWMQEAAGRDADQAFLEVAEDNTAAQALYKRCGFVQAGIRPGYYARPGADAVAALLLARPLPWDTPPDSRTKRSKSG
jgi:ribosomal-protein-alanine N-acetyltransferase